MEKGPNFERNDRFSFIEKPVFLRGLIATRRLARRRFSLGVGTARSFSPTPRAVMRSAAETLKPVLFELGGKNALIAFPDAEG